MYILFPGAQADFNMLLDLLLCSRPVPARLQANLFKTEKDKVTRALLKEVGDDTPLSKLVEAGSDWRGRAQQISLLKAKVTDLQQAQVSMLDSSQCHASLASLRTACSTQEQRKQLTPCWCTEVAGSQSTLVLASTLYMPYCG